MKLKAGKVNHSHHAASCVLVTSQLLTCPMVLGHSPILLSL